MYVYPCVLLSDVASHIEQQMFAIMSARKQTDNHTHLCDALWAHSAALYLDLCAFSSIEHPDLTLKPQSN